MIENDAEMAAASDEMSDTVVPRKKKKLDPEKVKGNQDDEEFGSGIWLSDADFAKLEAEAKADTELESLKRRAAEGGER